MKVEYILGVIFTFYGVQLVDNSKDLKLDISVLMRANRVEVQWKKFFNSKWKFKF